MAITPAVITKRWLWRSKPVLACFRRQFSSSHLEAARYLIHEPIKEELFPRNRLRHFHPTHPGDILDGRFKTIANLGFGSASTVCLAENLKFSRWKKALVPSFVSIKIAALDVDASGEAMRSKLISHANPEHEGLFFLRVPVDEFRLEGPRGTHPCFVYEPMRETVSQFRYRLENDRLPLPYFKLFTYGLLQALDYLHTECHLIHKDIKEGNIMVAIENTTVLDSFVKERRERPHPRHVRSEDGRVVYLSQDDLGHLQDTRLLPNLGDFDQSFPGLDKSLGHLSPIQSHLYRAPEVFLGCPWSYSADIWNIGVLMWNLLQDVNLFGRPAGEDGEYDAHVHLARMASLLDDPPPELVERERRFRNHQLGKPFISMRGKECFTINGLWGGPFFDEHGEIYRKDLVRKDRTLGDTVTGLDEGDKAAFLDLASGMVDWLPERRKTANELLQHPFFDSLDGSENGDIEENTG